MNNVLQNGDLNSGIEKPVRKESKKSADKESGSGRAGGKFRQNSRVLKNHLKYLVPELKLVLIRESGVKPIKISSADCVSQFVEPLRHYSEEHFIAFHLDTKFHVIGFHQVSHGTLSASLVHPREVFKAALLSNSYAIIVAHNHPSQSLNASKEDLETTKTLIEAGQILGVTVLDHLIVTATGLTSLREEHSHLWP